MVEKKKSLSEILAERLEQQIEQENQISDLEEIQTVDDLANLRPASIVESKTIESDEELFYAKDGLIYRTSLHTKDTTAFLEWAAFVHPLIKYYPKDIKTLSADGQARKELWYVLKNGISLYTTWLRNPRLGPPTPFMYKDRPN
jgi:hypothetical protein